MRFIDNIAQKLLEDLSGKYPNDCIQVTFYIPKKGYWEGSFGYTKTDRLVNNSTIFGVGSITKFFTAIIVLKSIQKGLIQLDDYVTKYINSDYFNKVKVINLLNHTSGLPDYSKDETLWIESFNELDKKYSDGEILEYIYASKESYEVGDFEYNGTNYFLLGLILRKIYNLSLSEIFSNNVFEPFDLCNTYIALEDQLKDNENICCELIQTGSSIYSIPGAAGNILSNSNDLTKFLNNFFNSDYLSEKYMNVFLNFNSYNYGLGVQKIFFSNKFFYGHDGVIPYSSGMIFYEPRSKICGSYLTTYIEKQYGFLDVIEQIFNYFIKAI